VLVGFSHVRWDTMILDAAGHRPHDCERVRLEAAAARLSERPVVIPELPAEARLARRIVAPVVPAAQVAVAIPRPRRRPAATRSHVAATNSCEACGNLKALRNGEWVCLHCA
jgi:hypothetical protein